MSTATIKNTLAKTTTYIIAAMLLLVSTIAYGAEGIQPDPKAGIYHVISSAITKPIEGGTALARYEMLHLEKDDLFVLRGTRTMVQGAIKGEIFVSVIDGKSGNITTALASKDTLARRIRGIRDMVEGSTSTARNPYGSDAGGLYQDTQAQAQSVMQGAPEFQESPHDFPLQYGRSSAYVFGGGTISKAGMEMIRSLVSYRKSNKIPVATCGDKMAAFAKGDLKALDGTKCMPVCTKANDALLPIIFTLPGFIEKEYPRLYKGILAQRTLPGFLKKLATGIVTLPGVWTHAIQYQPIEDQVIDLAKYGRTNEAKAHIAKADKPITLDTPVVLTYQIWSHQTGRMTKKVYGWSRAQGSTETAKAPLKAALDEIRKDYGERAISDTNSWFSGSTYRQYDLSGCDLDTYETLGKCVSGYSGVEFEITGKSHQGVTERCATFVERVTADGKVVSAGTKTYCKGQAPGKAGEKEEES